MGYQGRKSVEWRRGGSKDKKPDMLEVTSLSGLNKPEIKCRLERGPLGIEFANDGKSECL